MWAVYVLSGEVVDDPNFDLLRSHLERVGLNFVLKINVPDDWNLPWKEIFGRRWKRAVSTVSKYLIAYTHLEGDESGVERLFEYITRPEA